jgi:hypothetical protein
MRCENSWMEIIAAVPDSKGFRLPSERLCCKITHSVMRNLAREEEADTTSSHCLTKIFLSRGRTKILTKMCSTAICYMRLETF